MRNIIGAIILADVFIFFMMLYSLLHVAELGPTVYNSAVVLVHTGEKSCTGFIVRRGLIVTAGHCLGFDDRDRVIRFIDGEEQPYKVLQYSGEHGCADDWALLTADTGDRPMYAMNADDLDFGDAVMHIGHPRGVLSEIEQPARYLGSAFFSGTAIPGESGSPLINERNQAVGIVTCSDIFVPVSIFTSIEQVKTFIEKLLEAL